MTPEIANNQNITYISSIYVVDRQIDGTTRYMEKAYIVQMEMVIKCIYFGAKYVNLEFKLVSI